jgi:hypothetical protein
VGGYTQAFVVDRATGVPTQITFEPFSKAAPVVWHAPEFGGALTLQVSVARQAVAIYIESGGAWNLYKTIILPSTKPFVASPKLFVNDGKSYLAIVAADALGGGGGAPVGQTEIWLADVASLQTTHWRIDTPVTAYNRSDPENFLLEGELIIYYTEKRPNNFLLNRADAGLLPGD